MYFIEKNTKIHHRINEVKIDFTNPKVCKMIKVS